MANDMKFTPGAEFGVLLKRYFQKPPVPPKVTHSVVARWTPETFAEKVGKSARSVRHWLTGNKIPDDLDAIIRVLFGSDPSKFQTEIDELVAVVDRCRYRRDEKTTLPEGRVAFAKAVIYSDTDIDLAVLTYRDIDLLPVEPEWRFDELHYGEGTQKVVVPGESLFWLPPSEQMLDAAGERRPLTAYFTGQAEETNRIERQREVYFPRRVVVKGVKRNNAAMRLYACTDQPYVNEPHLTTGDRFECEAYLGLGGIAAFLNRDGTLRQPTDIEMGNGLGCAVALVAVAYVNRIPRYRTPYCMAVRKGIRYPDDVWINPATGRCVLSGLNPSTARFLFQSRESKGNSFDMYVANFNGSRMHNLNETDETAWDGFVDEGGNSLVAWNGKQITFGSTVNGNGFIEKITREDRR